MTVGEADALETRPDGSPFTLFATESRLEPSVHPEVRVGMAVTRVLRAEASLSYATPRLNTRISSDVEGVPPVTATEQITQYLVEGALVGYLTRWGNGSLVPFVSGGAGYLRQLHEGRAFIETGRVYSVGGGLSWMLKSGTTPAVKALGLRVDARAVLYTGGIAIDDRRHVAPAVATSVFVRF